MFLASVDCVFLAFRSSENPKEGTNGREKMHTEISRRTPRAELFRLKKTAPIIQRQCSQHFYRERAQVLPCSLREWRTQMEHDTDERSGWNSTDKARFKDLERESKELRTTNDFPEKASAYFDQAELGNLFCR